MKRLANIARDALLLLAVIAFPILVVIFAVQGDWGPAAIIGVTSLMTWWRGRHNGRYVPEAMRVWLASRRRT